MDEESLRPAGDKVPLNAGKDASYGTLPANSKRQVRMRSANGKDKTIDLDPHLPGWLPEPPGGWYGPFGFLRLVTYGFLFLAGVGTLCLCVALLNIAKEVVPVFSAVLLILASLLAAKAAYSHEGLANQVTEVAKQNNKYASLNDNLKGQVSELDGTAARLEKWAQKGQDTYNHLLSVLNGLTRVKDLANVNVIIGAFTTAEMREFMFEQKPTNHRVSDLGEINSFFDGCGEVLKHNLPDLDLCELRELGLRGGIGITCLALIIGAVCCDNDGEDDMARAEGMVSLTLFILDPAPAHRTEVAVEALAPMLVKDEIFNTEAKLRKELARLRASPSGKAGRVSEEQVAKLTQAVLSVKKIATKK